MDSGELELFEAKYAQYNNNLKAMINMYDFDNFDNLDVSMIYKDLECESYEDTTKIADSYYIYRNYKGRLKNGQVISKEYIWVNIATYKIEYYLTYIYNSSRQSDRTFYDC